MAVTGYIWLAGRGLGVADNTRISGSWLVVVSGCHRFALSVPGWLPAGEGEAADTASTTARLESESSTRYTHLLTHCFAAPPGRPALGLHTDFLTPFTLQGALG